MLGHRKRTEQALAEMRKNIEIMRLKYEIFRSCVEDRLVLMDKELREAREESTELGRKLVIARAENAALLERLEALERAHWHKGIENNCTECRKIWNK